VEAHSECGLTDKCCRCRGLDLRGGKVAATRSCMQAFFSYWHKATRKWHFGMREVYIGQRTAPDGRPASPGLALCRHSLAYNGHCLPLLAHSQTPIEPMNTEPNDKLSTEDEAGQLRQAVVSERASSPCPNCRGAGWHIHCDRWGNLTGTSQCLICHGSGIWHVR